MGRTETCSGLSTRAFAICSMSSFIAPPNSFCALVCRSGIRTGARCARFLCDLGFTGCSWRCLGVRFSRLSSHLLAFEFLRQFTLEALLFAGFQKKGVPLHLLDNALLLNLSLETPKGALEGFAVVNSHFCQNMPPRHLRSSREYDCRRLIKQGVFPKCSVTTCPRSGLFVPPTKKSFST